ncbi:hypothetical protein J4449_04105 [Candidatus Woesearchaeota archaeon]|nr:hypothetical protein [Candidatus Woesearchaeota archaeon]
MGVYAFGTSSPPVFGHSAEEIDFTNLVTFRGSVVALNGISANTISTKGLLTNLQGPGTYFDVSLTPIVYEAGVNQVGRTIYLGDLAAPCADANGCRLTLSMVNSEGGRIGEVASREARLFISENSYLFWRLSNDIQGKNSDDIVHEWVAWDCIFTDAENNDFSNNAIGNNARVDRTAVFGLLNAAGGLDDSRTKCRLVVED